ncbi:alginate export family protein [Sphingomonas sp. IC-56]|uniref:alginate export family protein n=1 Tax=Sphingomonas sp. IC-56 TaxID=2898529 RepID=UPI001E39AD9D|nr:alginate export family protein [Sphingomonas sp. IC-56]MCD2325344.1 alginate export family protein [Sphingomonas sp. IC-56]
MHTSRRRLLLGTGAALAATTLPARASAPAAEEQVQALVDRTAEARPTVSPASAPSLGIGKDGGGGLKQRVGARKTAAPASDSYPAAGAGDGVTTGGYNQSRWAEDWTRFRDPTKIDDPIDRLKFIPLAADGDVYLTLSGELRLRVNQTTNPNLRQSEAQRQDINRVFLVGDLHLGEHVRFYGELAHGGLSGLNLGTKAANLSNDLAVQQAFVDVTGDVAGVDLGLRYGRQTFTDGSVLLVGVRDNNTLYVTFNGVRAWAKGTRVRADIFDFKPTEYGTGGPGDDRAEQGRRLSGLTTGFALPETMLGGSKLYLDPFVWRLRDSDAAWGGVNARELRKLYGVHFWGDAGPVTIDWTLNKQGGSFDDRAIDAWLVLLAQTYRLGDDRSAPRVGFHFDYAMGGGAYGSTGKLRSALAPFGNSIYYSYQLIATTTNFVALAPNVSFQPLPKVRATLEYQFSWRDSLDDAVYRANGTPFAGTQNVDGRKIAETARAQIVWTISPRVSLTGRYEHVKAGSALTGAGYRDSDFLAGWLNIRF